MAKCKALTRFAVKGLTAFFYNFAQLMPQQLGGRTNKDAARSKLMRAMCVPAPAAVMTSFIR